MSATGSDLWPSRTTRSRWWRSSTDPALCRGHIRLERRGERSRRLDAAPSRIRIVSATAQDPVHEMRRAFQPRSAEQERRRPWLQRRGHLVEGAIRQVEVRVLHLLDTHVAHSGGTNVRGAWAPDVPEVAGDVDERVEPCPNE